MELLWSLRRWELLPEIVLGDGLGWFALTERSAAMSAFNSRNAILLVVLTGAG